MRIFSGVIFLFVTLFVVALKVIVMWKVRLFCEVIVVMLRLLLLVVMVMVMGVFGYFVGTENGTWGARIKILRPLFNTNTPPKTPI